jgi:membrane protein YqaA with SNARE-associated domain
MAKFAAHLETVALALGAPGLLLVAFLDSSFLSLPEISDLLVVWMVMEHKSRLVLYVAAATLGSLAGCLVMYYLGRRGGEALVRRRFSGAAVDSAMASFNRFGVMAVFVPSILPPPAPFKIFVILAGVADMGFTRFASTILAGRALRYLIEGTLAIWYGEKAIAFAYAHGRALSIMGLVFVVAGVVAYLAWSKTAGRRGR